MKKLGELLYRAHNLKDKIFEKKYSNGQKNSPKINFFCVNCKNLRFKKTKNCLIKRLTHVNKKNIGFMND